VARGFGPWQCTWPLADADGPVPPGRGWKWVVGGG